MHSTLLVSIVMKNSTRCTSVQCCRLLEPHLMRFKLILPRSQIQPPLLCSTVLTELSLRPFTEAPQQHLLLETCMSMHVNPYRQQTVVFYRNCSSCLTPLPACINGLVVEMHRCNGRRYLSAVFLINLKPLAYLLAWKML